MGNEVGGVVRPAAAAAAAAAATADWFIEFGLCCCGGCGCWSRFLCMAAMAVTGSQPRRGLTCCARADWKAAAAAAVALASSSSSFGNLDAIFETLT